MKINLAEIYIFRHHKRFSKITVFGSSYQVNPSRKHIPSVTWVPPETTRSRLAHGSSTQTKVNSQTDPKGSSAPTQVEQQEQQSRIRLTINHYDQMRSNNKKSGQRSTITRNHQKVEGEALGYGSTTPRNATKR